MAAKGAKYRLKEGKILHLASLWQAPSKRRIPRILIEDRAMEVGIKMYLDGLWMVFEETKLAAEGLDTNQGILCTPYYKQYHLLPSTIEGKDTYDWLRISGNALLLWGKDEHYFIKALTS